METGDKSVSHEIEMIRQRMRNLLCKQLSNRPQCYLHSNTSHGTFKK